MRVLVAPQEFKGSLSAEEAADAIAAGLRSARPEWEIDLLPMSDGGPGFIDAMRRAVRCDMVAEIVQDPLGRPVLARYLVTRDGQVFIEAAQANGLRHVAEHERNARIADTFGVGQLLALAVRHDPKRIVIGVGGSATTDGAAGMARALGAILRAEDGTTLSPGGASLLHLARIDWAPPPWIGATEVVIASDVVNPLTGANGAAAVYGPQKGASPTDVDVLEAALQQFAFVVRRSLGIDIAHLPGGGAAGGLAAGIVAFLGGRIESGFDVVARGIGLEHRLGEADLVVTGEGSFDAQSLQGKTTGRLIALSLEHATPIAVFAGAASERPANVDVIAISPPGVPRERAMEDAAEVLRASVVEWASSYSP